MPAGTEMGVLRYIDQQGGETRIGNIKRLLGSAYGTTYVEIICSSLGRNDYIDWLKDGTIRLTEKGWRVVGKWPAMEQALQRYLEKPPESPEEKYRRWLGKTLEEESIAAQKGRKAAGRR